jgi:hypothetical protein
MNTTATLPALHLADLAAVTPVQAAAVHSIQRGWPVVPIPAGEKGPILDGWQNLRLTVEDAPRRFPPGANLGRLLGDPSGLVDIDLDCPEAIMVADLFLSQTGMVHGRPSKPRSHRWYQPKPIPPTKQYKEINGKMLVELRSTGGQTVSPPSVHPSGEMIAWDSEGEPATVAAGDLQVAVAKVAAAALIARHWPAEGSRHEAARALAGLLLRAEWTEEAVITFIEAIITAARDPECRDRIASVRSTVKARAAEKRTTGGPTLASLLSDGEKVVERVREWLALPRYSEQSAARLTPTPTWPTLPSEALYGLAGDIVRAVDPFTEADPVGVLVNTLVAFGNIAGRGPGFPVESTRHQLNLFAVLVGPTAQGRKGQSWSTPRKLYRVVDEEWVRTRVVEGLSTGEGLIHAVRDPIYRTERNRKDGVVEDVLADAGVEDKRLLAIEGEFSQVLKVGTRDGNILSPVLRRAWDGADVLSPLTKTAPIRATGAHVSIIGHITQEELLRHLTETEAANGWCNRFLWVLVRRSKFLPDGEPVPGSIVDDLARRLTVAVDFAKTGGELTRDLEATDLWRRIYPHLSTPRPGLVGAILGRAEAQVMRLACLYALLDGYFVIRKPHLRAALSLWDYLDQSAVYIFGERLGDPVADDAYAAIREAGKEGLTETGLHAVFGRNLAAGRLRVALQSLASLGLIVPQSETTAGRPRTRWIAIRPGYEEDEITKEGEG